VENIAIIGYFEEIRGLIRKKPVNVAGLQCLPFWAGGVVGSVRGRGSLFIREYFFEKDTLSIVCFLSVGKEGFFKEFFKIAQFTFSLKIYFITISR